MKRPLFLIVLRYPFRSKKNVRWVLYVSFVLMVVWGWSIVATLQAAGGKDATLDAALRASGFLTVMDARDPWSKLWGMTEGKNHPTKQTEPSLRWVTHESQYGFSIALPEGWVFKDLMGEEKNGIEVDWTFFAQDPKEAVTLLVQRLKTDDLKGWVDQGILLAPGIEAEHFEPYAEGKKIGYRLRYRQKDPKGRDYDAREIYLEINRHTYVRLAMFAPAGALQEELFSEIVNRFRIHESESKR